MKHTLPTSSLPPSLPLSLFQFISQANVFKVCDQPHPLLMKEVLDLCAGSGDLKAAQEK